MTHAAVAASLPAWGIGLLTALSCLLLALLLVPGRRPREHRSVLVHVPLARAWEVVGDLPSLIRHHGRLDAARRIESWALQRGDGRIAGTIWRVEGRWGVSPYSAELEILACEAPHRLEFRLRRDSLRTHRGLLEHCNSMTLEAIGPERTKISWTLRARLRAGRLRAAWLLSRPRLQARLFDVGLRSIKMALEQESRDDAPSARTGVPLDAPGRPPLDVYPAPSVSPGSEPRSTLG
jgi:hypothetical protein